MGKTDEEEEDLAQDTKYVTTATPHIPDVPDFCRDFEWRAGGYVR